MKQKTSKIIYQYWNEVRGDRVAPRRFDIEPSRIAQILPETFILEQVDDQSYRFRLAGTRICENFGTELRGRNFLDLWETEDRLTLEGHLADLASRGGVGVLSIAASSAEGRACRLEAILLPLIHMKPVADRFLGALSAVDQLPWLGSEPLTTIRLTNHETLWPDGRPHALIQRSQTQAPFHPALASARLVRSDRRQFRVFEGGRAAANGEDDAS